MNQFVRDDFALFFRTRSPPFGIELDLCVTLSDPNDLGVAIFYDAIGDLDVPVVEAQGLLTRRDVPPS